jgi:addiction module RelE/StbE family toxin
MVIEFVASFPKKAAKLIKQNPLLKEEYERLLRMLVNNPYDQSLKTHALRGNLKGKYSCSLTHNLRVVLQLSPDAIRLLDIGTHDDVY